MPYFVADIGCRNEIYNFLTNVATGILPSDTIIRIVERSGLPDREVIVVEDLEFCATTLEIALETIPGVHVRVVRTAQQALEILLAPDSDVSAIITDLHLPAMNGLELIGRVRAERRTERLPIIVISGDTDPKTPELAYRIGANAFFEKPYSPARLRQALEGLLEPTGAGDDGGG